MGCLKVFFKWFFIWFFHHNPPVASQHFRKIPIPFGTAEVMPLALEKAQGHQVAWLIVAESWNKFPSGPNSVMCGQELVDFSMSEALPRIPCLPTRATACLDQWGGKANSKACPTDPNWLWWLGLPQFMGYRVVYESLSPLLSLIINNNNNHNHNNNNNKI